MRLFGSFKLWGSKVASHWNPSVLFSRQTITACGDEQWNKYYTKLIHINTVIREVFTLKHVNVMTGDLTTVSPVFTRLLALFFCWKYCTCTYAATFLCHPCISYIGCLVEETIDESSYPPSSETAVGPLTTWVALLQEEVESKTHSWSLVYAHPLDTHNLRGELFIQRSVPVNLLLPH